MDLAMGRGEVVEFLFAGISAPDGGVEDFFARVLE